MTSSSQPSRRTGPSWCTWRSPRAGSGCFFVGSTASPSRQSKELTTPHSRSSRLTASGSDSLQAVSSVGWPWTEVSRRTSPRSPARPQGRPGDRLTRSCSRLSGVVASNSCQTPRQMAPPPRSPFWTILTVRSRTAGRTFFTLGDPSCSRSGVRTETRVWRGCPWSRASATCWRRSMVRPSTSTRHTSSTRVAVKSSRSRSTRRSDSSPDLRES